MARKTTEPKPTKGPACSHNPLNYVAPKPTEIRKVRQLADLSKAEAARCVGIVREDAMTKSGKRLLGSKRTNINWHRFEDRKHPRDMKFSLYALLRILVLDDDAINYRGGMPDGVALIKLRPRRSTRSIKELTRNLPHDPRQPSTFNPLNYLAPSPNQIALARERAGHSQREAALVIGISQRAWQSYEYAEPRKKGGKTLRQRLEMPFNLWALYNILALDDSAANWRTGLPSEKSPFPRTGYRVSGMNVQEIKRYAMKRSAEFRKEKKKAQRTSARHATVASA